MWEETGDTGDHLNCWTFQEEEVRSLGWNPSPQFIGLCLPGLMRPNFFFFPAGWKFPGCCGAVAGRMLMAEPCPWPRVGGSAVTVVVTVLAAITVVRWLLLPSSLSWFSTVSISHMRAEKRSLLVPNPPALRPRRPCLICWHLASPGNILPTYFSRIFLKSSAS